jgi:hypothetical protein
MSIAQFFKIGINLGDTGEQPSALQLQSRDFFGEGVLAGTNPSLNSALTKPTPIDSIRV